MKAKLLALAVISAFALSACGGDDSKPKVDNTTKPAQNGGDNNGGATGGGSTGGGTTGGGTTGGGSTGGGSTGGGSTGGGSTGGGSTGGGSTGGGSTGGGSTDGGSTGGGSTGGGSTGGGSTGGSTGGGTTGGSTGGSTGGGSTSTETPFTMKQQVATFKQTIKNGEPVSMTNTPTYSTSNGDGDNFKKITVNGYTFTMLDTSGNAALDEDRTIVGQENNYGEYQVIPNINNRGTAYAKYGFTIDYKTGNFNLFYQGKPTPVAEVPTTGKATYQGYAFALDPVEYNKHITQERDYGEWKGVSEFTADFDKKTLTGTLRGWHSSSQTDPKAVQINAKIQANTFQGTANGTGTAEGKFYGANAQNLAGAFNDKSQNLQGVFGANKQ